MSYVGHKLKDIIVIDNLYAIHFLELQQKSYSVERPLDAWEIIYVDRGNAVVSADNLKYSLTQDEVLIFKSANNYRVISNSLETSNIFIFSFSCGSDGMHSLEHKHFIANQNQRKLIMHIISEYNEAFTHPSGKHGNLAFSHRENALIGAEQLLKQGLCELIISFLRNNFSYSSKLRSGDSSSLLEVLVSYIENNVFNSLQIKDLVKYSGSNKTTITNIFNAAFNMSPIQYYINLKTEYAKAYIREGKYNITQIAEFLGYSSIHYFSRQFKKTTGMSPSEYLCSIKNEFN